jgi:hypothetical protein
MLLSPSYRVDRRGRFAQPGAGNSTAMADLLLHDRPIRSVFQLLGSKENDITYSIGWALANAPKFLDAVVDAALPSDEKPTDPQVRLQSHEPSGGFTDIEVVSSEHHLIVEAKRGFELPGVDQVAKYLPRLEKEARRHQGVLVLAEWLSEYGASQMGVHRGVDVRYMSWSDLTQIAKAESAVGRHHEKRLLKDLVTYMEGIVSLQNQTSNEVHCVSLGKDTWHGLTFKQIVREHRKFFHPVGRRYPKEPVNYIAFRVNGKVESIHHVERWAMLNRPADHFPTIARDVDYTDDPHYIYDLGPAIPMAQTVVNGDIWPSAHVKVALDLLLTSESVSEARDRTNARLRGDSGS